MNGIRRRARVRLLAAAATAALTLGFALPAGASEPVRVMPLGDSITEGADGDATYRYFLWHDFLDGGYGVDFVGSMYGVKGRRAQPKYPDFDQDHEGHSGWTATKIGKYAYTFAVNADPDIVLLHAGTNDLLRGIAPSKIAGKLQKIIVQLRQANPQVAVFIAEIIPIRGMESQVADLNSRIRTLAGQLNSASSPVISVDQFSGFDVNADLKTDGIHPTESGFVKMGDRWYQAVASYLNS